LVAVVGSPRAHGNIALAADLAEALISGT